MSMRSCDCPCPSQNNSMRIEFACRVYPSLRSGFELRKRSLNDRLHLREARGKGQAPATEQSKLNNTKLYRYRVRFCSARVDSIQFCDFAQSKVTEWFHVIKLIWNTWKYACTNRDTLKAYNGGEQGKKILIRHGTDLSCTQRAKRTTFDFSIVLFIVSFTFPPSSLRL